MPGPLKGMTVIEVSAFIAPPMPASRWRRWGRR